MPVAKRAEPVPYWMSECGRAVIYVGDCCRVMAAMKPDQFHAIVTDPPYGLEFMGKDWDAPWKANGVTDARHRRSDELGNEGKAKYLWHSVEYGRADTKGFQDWFMARSSMMLRVAKPGAHLLSFGGTRMWHRMACAIEDSGFEIRDSVMWLYGSGFPKGADISKAIDKLQRAKRVTTGLLPDTKSMFENLEDISQESKQKRSRIAADEPVTEDAIKWNGWNTALKPAWEPIIVARKDHVGSVAQNTLKHGCGAMNTGGCRVEAPGEVVESLTGVRCSGSGVYGFNRNGDKSMSGENFVQKRKDSRHPANLIHDGSDEVVLAFPADKNAARFFYSAKAGDSDRPHGRTNTHPTVKPTSLMRYLVRLVAARGSLVLDPFMGSGSTGCAAILEGMQFVGIEQDAHYADIAIGKLNLSLVEYYREMNR